MNATEAPHSAAPRAATTQRPANAAHAAGSAASTTGKAGEGAAPADPFAALLDGLCLPDAETGSAQAAAATTATDALTDDAKAQPAGKHGVAAAQAAAPDAFLAMLMPGAMAASATTAMQAGTAKADPLLANDASPAASTGGKAAAGTQKHGEAVPDFFLASATEAAGKQAPAADFNALLAAAGGTAAVAEKRESSHASTGADLASLTGVGQAAAQPAMVTPDATPAAPVHQASLHSHPMDPAFASDLGAEVQWMVDAGVQQADLHLNPADLGPIRIQLSLNAQTADISFAAAHGATREGITQALPQLREMLAGQGLQLGQAGVSGGQGGNQSFAQAERQAPRAPARASGGTAGAVDAAPRARSGSATLRAGRGMLDLYA